MNMEIAEWASESNWGMEIDSLNFDGFDKKSFCREKKLMGGLLLSSFKFLIEFSTFLDQRWLK
jgi:hypothetical protein